MLEINKVYNMDCMIGLDEIDKNSIDLVVTDPPYDVDYNEKFKNLQKLQKESNYNKQIERDKDFKGLDINYDIWLRELFRVLKTDSHCYIFCGTSQIPILMNKGQEAGFKFSTLCLWLKNRQTFNLGIGYNYNYKTENLLFFRKGTKKLNNLGHSNIFKYDVKQKLDIHPTEKPVNLIKDIILNSSKEGDLVLDTFMGSGSTAITCLETKRNFIGFELSEKYYQSINKRLDNYSNSLTKWI